MFGNVFKDKSVLVTGHTGFKGSWLALWLHELGAKVIGLALPPNTEPSHFDLIRLQDLITHTEGDIRNHDIVQKTFEKAKPEIVFHLAAQALVRDSYDDPKTTFDTNVDGTVNILEAIRHCPSVKAAVVITSDKCYENREWVWGYRENDPMGGHDPYSASKGAAEIACAAYRRSFFDKNGRGPHLGFATARAGNVIGGGDWGKDRIIPDCVRALSTEGSIMVRNPNATRPWQHVLDPLCGYLLLVKRLLEDPERFSGSWNFGPTENGQIKVIDLADKFVKTWGSGQIKTPPSEKSALHEANLLRLCIDKAVHEIHWKPILDSRAAIHWTADWYKSWHLSNDNLRSLSLNQIRNFKEMAVKKGS
jgi:CDP-glucose 4,6-dehydratase